MLLPLSSARSDSGVPLLAAGAVLLALACGLAAPFASVAILLPLLSLLLVGLAWTRPDLGFVVFWLSLFWVGPGFPTGLLIGPFQLNLMDVLIALFLGVCLLQVLARELRLAKPPVVMICVTIFLVAAFVTGMAHNRTLAVLTDTRPFLYLLVLWLWMAILTSSYDRRHVYLVWGYAFGIGSVGAFVKALLVQLNSLPSMISTQFTVYALQADGLGGERVILIGPDTLFTVAVPILLACALERHSRGQAFPMILGLASAVLGLALTFTRSAWIAAILGAIIVVSVGSSRRETGSGKRLLIILLAVGGALFLAGNAVFGQNEVSLWTMMGRRVSGDYDQGGGLYGLTQFRAQEGMALIEAWSQSPLIGQGLGGTYNFLLFSAGLWADVQWSHNGWLWLLLKGGVFGLALFVYPFLALTRNSLHLLHSKTGDLASQATVVGLMGAFVAFGVMSITNNRLASPDGQAFLGAWLALMSYSARRQERNERRVPTTSH